MEKRTNNQIMQTISRCIVRSGTVWFMVEQMKWYSQWISWKIAIEHTTVVWIKIYSLEWPMPWTFFFNNLKLFTWFHFTMERVLIFILWHWNDEMHAINHIIMLLNGFIGLDSLWFFWVNFHKTSDFANVRKLCIKSENGKRGNFTWLWLQSIYIILLTRS